MAEYKVPVEIEVKRTEQAKTSVKSLRTQIRELELEITSGKLKGKDLDEAIRRAGDLRDQMGDLREKVNAYASDTRRLDALVEVGQGIAGGFAAVQGAMAMMGKEGEDLQKTLVKVQSALALMNGLQQVGTILTKKGAASTMFFSHAQKLAQMTIGGTTGALKAFRIALVGTGIGAAVVGLTMLVANFKKVKDAVLNLVPGLEKVGEFFKKIFKTAATFIVGQAKMTEAEQKKSLKRLVEQQEKEKKILEAKGQDTYNIEKQIIENKLKLTKEGSEEYMELKQELAVLEVRQEKAINDKRLKEQEEYQRRLEEQRKKEAEMREAVAEMNAAIEDSRYKRFLEQLERQKEAEEKALEEYEERQKEQADIDRQIRDMRIQNMAEGIEKELALEQAAYEDKKEQAKGNAYLLEEIEKEHVNNVLAIREKQKKDTIALEQAERDARIQIATDIANMLIDIAGMLTKDAKKLEQIRKASALVKIAQDTATAISSLMAASEGNPLNLLTGGAAGIVQFTTGLARILANVAQAKALLSGQGGGSINVSMSGSQVAVPQAGQSSVLSGQVLQHTDEDDEQRLAPVKAYVVESESQATARRLAKIERRATI